MAAIAHVVYRETSAQARTNTAYGDVSANTVIPDTDFVAGAEYLLLVWCQSSMSVSSANAGLQVVHGSTAFADSEKVFQPNNSNTKQSYFYWERWTAVSGEAITLQHKATSGTVTTDQVVMVAIRLDADLTADTDYVSNTNTTSNPLGTAFEDGATVTWTPGTANDVWLLLHKHQATASGVTSQGESRGNLQGATFGLWSEEGELAATDIHYHSFARAAVLPASSQTFTVQGRSETVDIFTHLRSGVFALNLSKFKDVTQAFTATAVGYGTTSWANVVQTLSHTKTVDGDVLVIGANIYVPLSTTTNFKARLRQDDTTDRPDTQTTDIYPMAGTQNDSTDQSGFCLGDLFSISADILMEIEGHASVATTPTYSDRALVCFSMELAVTAVAIPPLIMAPYKPV